MKRLLYALLFLGAHAAAYAGHPPALVPGTYGVHYTGTGPAGALPMLTLRPDFTFLYTNPSGATSPQDLTGTWALVGRRLVLTSSKTKPMNWAVDPNGQCLATRKGLCFTRLCQLSR